MTPTLQRCSWALGLLAVAWLKPDVGWAQQYLGNNLVTNGNFSAQPAGTSLAAGNNLGGWTSGFVYQGNGVYPGETRLSDQTGAVNYSAGNVVQNAFPGDAANGIAASSTWLLYNGNSNSGAFIWQQGVAITSGYAYVLSYYVSNATAPTVSGRALPVVRARVMGTNLNSNLGAANTLGQESTTAGGQDVWTRYQIAIPSTLTSGLNTITLGLLDASGATTTAGGDLALTGISLRRINQLPRGQQTAPTVFGRQGIVQLPTLRADDPDPDGSVVAYKIKVLPPASQGVLLLNGTPVRTNQVLTTAEAASLSFNPNQNFSGNALFTYTATDNVGDESLDLNYGIPVDANSCNTQSVFSFASRTVGEDWTTAKTSATSPAAPVVDGIRITSTYTAPSITPDLLTLLISDETGNDPGVSLPGKGLVWAANYANDASRTPSSRQSSLSFSFTDATLGTDRYLNNFTVVVGDIDRATPLGGTPAPADGFIDQVIFSGTQLDGSIVTLSAADVALSATTTFSNNTVTGSGPVSSPAGNITLAFPVPVKNVTITYTNAQNIDNPPLQRIALLNLSWCGEADLATTISGPATAAAGQTVFYYATTTNTGPHTTSSASTTIALPGKPAANTVNVPNGTYDASTGIVTFNTTTLAPGNVSVNYVSFVMPAGVTSFTGQAQSSALEIDNTAANNNGSAANANVTTTVGATGAAGTALGCPTTPGKDGTVASLTAAPNTYFLPAANAAANQKTISLSATTLSGTGAANAGAPLAPGDLVLIMQMQGAAIAAANDDTYGDGVAGPSGNGNTTGANFTAGRYEYGVVATTSATVTPGTAGTLTLRDNLTYAYTQAAATATQGQQRYQVIRIPQYIALTLGGTIAPPAWNGQLGGVLALDVAGPLNFNNRTLDASGAGFRGGAGRKLGGTAGLTNTDYRTANTSNGGKGEGTAGTPNYVATYSASGAAGTLVTTGSSYPSGDNGRGAPGNAGGGGTDGNPTGNDQNTGGGGGANGGRGGRGGNSWASNLAVGGEPGAAFPVASSSRLVLGGGGGAGGSNDGTGNDGTGGAFDGLASSGAPGGGIVLVRTGSVMGAGSILANGYNADNSVANDGSGGGGAGGTILLTAQNPSTLGSISLAAAGGTGGTNTGGGVTHGPGGGGGGGFVVTNGPAAAASAVAGASGTTVGAVPFGAETGTIGVGNPAISNSIAGSAANASCVADVASVLTGPATAVAGSTVNLDVNFSNYGGITATGVAARVSLPATLLNIVAPGATITGGVTQPYILTYASLTSLAVGTSQSYSISYSAPLPGGSSNVKADANISTASPESYVVNNPSTITTNLGNYADVTTTLTGPASVNPGLPTGDFTVNFTNNGPNTATGITQSVTLPTGASITSTQLAALQTKYPGVTVAYNTTTQVLSFTLPTTNNSLLANATNSYSFPITASATPGSAGITSNVGVGTGSPSQNVGGGAGAGAQPDAATYTFAVAPLADLVASITNNGTATVAGGGTGTFVATFTNSGPSAADNVTPTVQLPAGLTNVTFTGLGGTYNATTGLVTYPATATLASGSSLASTIRFTMPSSPVVAAASVNTTTNEGPYTANNAASATISSSSNFDVTTTITGPPSAAPGTAVTLSVLTQNLGPGVAPSTTQTVVIPGVYTSLYVSNGGTFSNNGTNTTVTFPAVFGLASGANVNNTITLTMPAVPVNNITATVTAAGETNSITNSNAASIGSTAAAAGSVNLYATIAAATADAPTTTLTGPVLPGTTLLLNIMTGNYGPTVAAGSVTQVALPAGLSGVIPSNEGTYNATTGIVTFPAVGSLAQGATMSYTIQLPAPSTGPLVPVVSISSTAPETVVADNVASTKVDIVPLADVTTSVSGAAAPTVGQSVTYAVTTANNGPTQAAGVVQTVQLPAGLSSVALTAANNTAIALPAGAYNATTGLLTLPTTAVAATQAAGASVLNYVTFTVPTSTGFPVTAAVSTTSQETNATNNLATIMTTPAPAADVSVALGGPSTVAQGNLVTYTVATTNAGPSVNPSSTTTVQLPIGLSNVQVSGGGSYNSSTGVVMFPVFTDQAAGAAGAVSNTISFVAPSTTPLTVTAQVAVTPAGNDPNLSNNSATVNTTVNSSNTNLIDESTIITATTGASNSAVSASNPVVAGGSVTFTATATNTNVAGTTSTAATNVSLRLQLPAGLNPSNVVLSSGSYDPATGVVTFSTLGTQNAGVTNNFTATINNVPGSATSLVATSYVSTTNSDSNPNNNVATATLPLAPRADVTTTISGPSIIAPNSPATYFVTVRNVGPSAANAVDTNVQLPTGLSGVVVSGGGSYDANSGLVTFPTVATLPGYSGPAAANTAAQAVAYSITLTAPSTITSTAGYTLTSTVSTATTELATQATNTASLTTTAANQPPVASNVVNSLQAPEGNTGIQMLISPLQATDPDGSVSSYTLSSLPTSGTLFYNNGGTYTAITSANLLGGTSPLNLTPTQAQTLRYTPAAGFAGNAFFGYVATDNASPALTSAAALYTIPVGADIASVYAKTPVKAAATAYAVSDVIAYVTDTNGALYNTSAQLYNTTSGALQTGALNGVASATSTGVFTSTQYGNITNLSQLGLALDATTGQLVVQTPGNLRAGSYTLNITTTDVYGGITTQPVTFTIGGTPLPVVLVEFTAQAVQQRDALLSWATASEANSAYFEVERSFDGTTFAAIGRLAAQGTKVSASTYVLNDAGVAAKATGAVYYRLRQVDIDGTATYSPQRTVSFPKVATVSLSLYPNPVASTTTLDLRQLPDSASYQVLLLDATGRQVRTWTLAGGVAQPLALTELASGSYLLVVTGALPDGALLKQTLRLTKE